MTTFAATTGPRVGPAAGRRARPAAAPPVDPAAGRTEALALRVITLYPVLWLIGLGGLFWPVLCLSLAFRTRFARATPESTMLLVIGQLLVLSVPIGVLTFGFAPQRVISVLANLSIWIATAAMVRLAARNPVFRAAVLQRVLVIVTFQGAVQLLALLAQPHDLPIPLLHPIAASLPSGMASFATNQIVYNDWLDGAALRSPGVMANPTWAGAVAGLGMMLAISRRGTRAGLLVRLGALAGGAVAIQLALSRSVQIALVASLALAGLEVLRRRLQLSITPWLIGLLAVPMLLLAYASRLVEYFASVNAEREGSAQTRGAIYAVTYDYIRQLPVPLLGYGIKPKSEGLVASVASHSTYLGLTFRAGLVATLLLVTVFALLAARAVRDANAIGLACVLFITAWCIFEDFDGGHLLPLGLIAATRPALPVTWGRRRRGDDG